MHSAFCSELYRPLRLPLLYKRVFKQVRYFVEHFGQFWIVFNSLTQVRPYSQPSLHNKEVCELLEFQVCDIFNGQGEKWSRQAEGAGVNLWPCHKNDIICRNTHVQLVCIFPLSLICTSVNTPNWLLDGSLGEKRQ